MENVMVKIKGDYVSQIFNKDIVSIDEILEKIVELDAEIEKLKDKNKELLSKNNGEDIKDYEEY